jgi:hypothetical protein
MQFLWIPRVGQSGRLSIRCWYHVLSGCNITIDEDAKKAIKRYHCENIGVLFYILTVASFGVNDNSTSSDFCRLMIRLSPCLLESVVGVTGTPLGNSPLFADPVKSRLHVESGSSVLCFRPTSGCPSRTRVLPYHPILDNTCNYLQPRPSTTNSVPPLHTPVPPSPHTPTQVHGESTCCELVAWALTPALIRAVQAQQHTHRRVITHAPVTPLACTVCVAGTQAPCSLQ